MVGDLERVRDELRLERGRLSAILSSMTEALIAFGGDGRVVLMNQAAAVLLRVAPESARGQTVETIAPFFRGERALREEEYPINLAKKHGVIIVKMTDDYYLVDSRGERVPVVFSAAILVGKEIVGDVDGVLLIKDVTEEKEIDRTKTEFVSLASHQLRTPLGSMRWNLELLGSSVKSLPPADQERFQEIYQSNLRVIGLVRDLLNVARIEQGRVKDEPEPTDAAAIVEAAVRELLPEAGARAVTLELTLKDSARTKVMIDPKHFREMIQNLLTNAVRYTKSGGRVVVDLEIANGSLVGTVTDNGVGIPAKDQPKIFSKFFRSGNAAKVDTDGSGLGLFIVQSYVTGWGGKVWFESTEGRGTTFHFSIPLK